MLIAPRLGRPRRASPLSVEGLQDAPKLLEPLLRAVRHRRRPHQRQSRLHVRIRLDLLEVDRARRHADGLPVGVCRRLGSVCVSGLHASVRPLSGDHAADDLRASPRSCAGLPIRWSGRSGWACQASSRVQALHGLSTGIMLIGVQKLIAETVDEERTGAAQGAAFFATGICMAIVTLLSGPLYDRFGAGRLLRDDRRCAGRAGPGPAFGCLSPRAPAPAVTPATPGRPAPASGRGRAAAVRRDR